MPDTPMERCLLRNTQHCATPSLTLTKYKPHRLTGYRAGYFALSVTPNWRITFGHDADDNEIIDLDYEDYH
jgi:plasmid maintenance system killer protein